MNGNSSTLSEILQLNANNIYESICDNIPILSLGSTSNKILTKLKWSLDNVTYIDNTLEIQEEQIIGVNFYGNKVFLTNGIYELLDDLSLGDKLNENIPSELKKSNNKSLIPINDKYYGIRDGINVSIYSFDEQSNELVLIETIEIQNINAIFGSGYQHNLFSSSYIYVFNTGDTLIGYNINGQNVYLNQSRNITTDKILSGYTSYAQDGSPISGTMTNNGELNITPSTQEQTIPEGYTSGGTINAVDNTIDSNIQANNIKKDVSILGITGTLQEGIDTSDADATSEDITMNKTAYVNGEKITGTLPLFPNTRTFTAEGGVTNDTENSKLRLTTINTLKQTLDSNLNMEFNAEYSDIATAIGLTADKIAQGNTILGIEGTYEGDNINDYIAVPADMTTIKIQNCIKKIPLIDTSAVTNMNYMFQNCTSLTTIPLLNTAAVTNMNSMFQNCTSLTEIPLIDTNKVTNMSYMFYGCTSLITIPQLDTSAVTNMDRIFYDCTSLITISQLDTSKVTNMSYMFYGCTALTTIPQLDTSKVTAMINMFNSCTALTNDSLNNILAMLTNATAYTRTKTLKYIGLSETQATTCTTLSNWVACEAAGWTTGYETT